MSTEANIIGAVEQAKKPLEVELNELSSCIVSVEEQVGRLVERLKPILTPVSAAPDRPTTGEQLTASPVVGAIREYIRRVCVINEIINELRESLEV